MAQKASVAPQGVVELVGVPTDATLLERLFASSGPYWNQGRYLPGAGAASQMPNGATTTIGVPWYRQDWALDATVLVPEAGAILHEPAFAEAATQVFGGSVVRPHTIYANVQLPAVGTDFGHTDVPEFRGVTRDRVPVALLHAMNRSGLFTRWQLDIATAVTWLWDGPRGSFLLWADGPEAPPKDVAAPLTGRAVVADNDRLFHAVGAFDTPDGPSPSDLTPHSEVHAIGDRFELRHGDHTVGSWPRSQVRCSVSWKAYVFADDADARRHDEHLDDLDPATVVAIFGDELRARGVAFDETAHRALDDSLVAVVAPLWPKRLPHPPV